MRGGHDLRLSRTAHDAGPHLGPPETEVSNDGSEFRSSEFVRTVTDPAAQRRLIQAGRPLTSSYVERVQHTILEEC